MLLSISPTYQTQPATLQQGLPPPRRSPQRPHPHLPSLITDTWYYHVSSLHTSTSAASRALGKCGAELDETPLSFAANAVPTCREAEGRAEQARASATNTT